MRKTLLIAVIIGLAALYSWGIALASANTPTSGTALINTLGDGGGSPEPQVDDSSVGTYGDGGGSPEPG